MTGVFAPIHGAYFARKLCDFLASLDDVSGKMIGRLLKEKATRDKSKKGGTNPRSGILKEKSNRAKSKRCVPKGKASAVA